MTLFGCCNTCIMRLNPWKALKKLSSIHLTTKVDFIKYYVDSFGLTVINTTIQI